VTTEIAVVGSLNLDIVVPVARHPAPGETVLGGDHTRHPGRGEGEAPTGIEPVYTALQAAA
jgi:sugar/nucleoside kinase (ribokinase family)